MNHYVYYSYEEWGPGYLGCRSCKCDPEEDTAYFGSFSDTNFKPTQKIVLKTFETRKEALEAEVLLHSFFNVAKNPHFANRAKQTSTGFDTTGRTFALTEETKQQMSNAKTGENHPLFGKTGENNPNFGRKHSDEAIQRMREAQLGKTASDETKQLMSDARRGENHPNFGKNLAEETRQRISESKIGKGWYVNAEGETRMCKENPGPEWQPGRKWKG
jgi:hypothetical protein